MRATVVHGGWCAQTAARARVVVGSRARPVRQTPWAPLVLSPHMPSHSPPALSDELKLEFPADHVLLLVMNRPKAMNAMTPQLEADLATALDWFDNEPDLWSVPDLL
jgi:hypothetical protein